MPSAWASTGTRRAGPDVLHELLRARGPPPGRRLAPAPAPRRPRSARRAAAPPRAGSPLGLQRAADHLGQGAVRLPRLPSALEQHGVARAERQRGDLHQRVGTRLEHHRQDAQRSAHLLQHQPLVELAAVRARRPSGSARAGELPRSLGQHLELGRVEPQPPHQRPGRAPVAASRSTRFASRTRARTSGAVERRGQPAQHRAPRPRRRPGRARPPASTARCTRSAMSLSVRAVLMTPSGGCRGSPARRSRASRARPRCPRCAGRASARQAAAS